MQPSASKPSNEDLKPLRKMRRLSGFNTWHAEYLRSTESAALPSLAAKNKRSAELWRELSEDQRSAYKEKAVATNTGTTEVNVKHECRKIYNLLRDLTEHANMIPGFHLMFVAVHNQNHVVGGTEMGEKFLREIGLHVPHSFLGYLSAANANDYDSSSVPPDQESECDDSKETLRKEVETLFNLRYGQSVGDRAARLPYKKIQEYGISMSGLPENKSLKHPSSYGRLTLKQILSNKDNITIEVRNHPTSQQHQQHQEQHATRSTSQQHQQHQEQHTTRPTSQQHQQHQEQHTTRPTSQQHQQHQEQHTTRPTTSSLTRTTKGTHASERANLSSTSSDLDHPYSAAPGSKVQLLINSKRVGMGTITGGNLLHGNEVPAEYAIVSVDNIEENTCPMYMTSFDEPFLHVGQFTAWPIAQLDTVQTQ